MNNIALEYEDEDFILYAIAVEESYQTIESFTNNLGGVSYPVLLDSNGTAKFEYEFDAQDAYAPFPRQYVIDKEGVVQYMAAQYYPDDLTAMIDALILE